jgi:hypothetical protein
VLWRAMVSDTRQRRFCVGARDSTDGRQRRGPTVPGAPSLMIIPTRLRVGTRSVEEHKPRRRDQHNPPHEPGQQQHTSGTLTKRREDCHEIWKHHRDDDPG